MQDYQECWLQRCDGEDQLLWAELQTLPGIHRRKEMKCSGDSLILYEIFHYTTRFSLCFSDFRAVLRTFSCSISESPLHLISFFNSCTLYSMVKRPTWANIILYPSCYSISRQNWKSHIICTYRLLNEHFFFLSYNTIVKSQYFLRSGSGSGTGL